MTLSFPGFYTGLRASLSGLVVKNPPANTGDIRDVGLRCGFDPWVRKILWRRKWQPTPVFLLGKFHRQRSLAGYSPWDCKELDLTKQLSHTQNHNRI